jgi:hypothetical protein
LRFFCDWMLAISGNRSKLSENRCRLAEWADGPRAATPGLRSRPRRRHGHSRRPYHSVRVELDGRYTRGMTVIDQRVPETGAVEVAWGVDAAAALALIRQSILRV